jgi:CheY-like chemotaxis protein
VVLDIVKVVTGMEKMLRKLIGENIDLEIIPGDSTWRIKADGGHVGQVLMNMAVNARDAMPHGGRLTIQIHDVTLSEGEARSHHDAVVGDYVMISVSDTGSGMTPEVRAHLFEPFFTTKERGKGTGLGLATCHTIIRQAGGHIDVSSQIGKGSTFKIYFPRIDQALELGEQGGDGEPLPRGTETLLFVEDEPGVLDLGCSVLESHGYQVLRAANGLEGLQAADLHEGEPIRLVMTDVVMPQMGGKVMVEWLKASNPDLRVLYTSGYTDDAIEHYGVLEPGVAFLSKPYSLSGLLRKVREVLDGESESTLSAAATVEQTEAAVM